MMNFLFLSVKVLFFLFPFEWYHCIKNSRLVFFFSFNTLHILLQCVLVCVVSNKKWIYYYSCSSISKMFCFSDCFQDFFFIFSFLQFEYKTPMFRFFGAYPAWCSLSYYSVIWFLQLILEIFLPLFFQIFSALLSLFSPTDILITYNYILKLFYNSWIFFFIIFSLYNAVWEISILPSSNSLILP